MPPQKTNIYIQRLLYKVDIYMNVVATTWCFTQFYSIIMQSLEVPDNSHHPQVIPD